MEGEGKPPKIDRQEGGQRGAGVRATQVVSEASPCRGQRKSPCPRSIRRTLLLKTLHSMRPPLQPLPLLMLTVLIRRILIGIFPSFLAHYENWSFPELRAASLGGRERVRDATNA